MRAMLLGLGWLVSVCGAAQAQSISDSKTTTETTVTREGNRTTTVTRSRTVSGGASVDAGKLGGAIAGAIGAARDPEEARARRYAEPARKEDVFGDWLADDGGRDIEDCRLTMGQKAGFLGVRPATASGCPGRMNRLRTWRVENGQLVFYDKMGQESGRLRFSEGRFYGQGLELWRP